MTELSQGPEILGHRGGYSSHYRGLFPVHYPHCITDRWKTLKLVINHHLDQFFDIIVVVSDLLLLLLLLMMMLLLLLLLLDVISKQSWNYFR